MKFTRMSRLQQYVFGLVVCSLQIALCEHCVGWGQRCRCRSLFSISFPQLLTAADEASLMMSVVMLTNQSACMKMYKLCPAHLALQLCLLCRHACAAGCNCTGGQAGGVTVGCQSRAGTYDTRPATCNGPCGAEVLPRGVLGCPVPCKLSAAEGMQHGHCVCGINVHNLLHSVSLISNCWGGIEKQMKRCHNKLTTYKCNVFCCTYSVCSLLSLSLCMWHHDGALVRTAVHQQCIRLAPVIIISSSFLHLRLDLCMHRNFQCTCTLQIACHYGEGWILVYR